MPFPHRPSRFQCRGRSPLPPVPPIGGQMHASLEPTVIERAHLPMVAKGTPFSFLARRMRGRLPLRRPIPVQRHAERGTHLLRRTLRHNAPPSGVCSSPQSRQPAVLSNSPQPGRPLPSRRHAARRTVRRKVNPFARRGILPILQIGHLRTARLLPNDHRDGDDSCFYRSKQRRSLNQGTFTAR